MATSDVREARRFGVGWGARLIWAASTVMVLLTVTACGGRIDVPQLTAQDRARLQAGTSEFHAVYRIAPGDTLQIRYPFHQELDQEALVQPDGRITATGIGPITVTGLTTVELEALLKERSSNRLRDPEVLVTIRTFADNPIFVGGEVGRPGMLTYRKGITALQAIIAAGGFRDTARIDSIILVRNGPTNGQFVARKLDLLRTISDGEEEPIQLAPNDVVFVPRTAIANANLWVRQHVTELFPFIRGTSLPFPGF